MKKIICLFFISSLFYGCSSSDSDSSDNDACPTPILNINYVSNTTASVNWVTQNVQSSLHEIQYGPLGFSLGSGTIEILPDPQYLISDLMPSTQYSFYTRVFCQSTNSFSNWAGPKAFITTENNDLCDDPNNLQVAFSINDDSIGYDYIDLSWSSTGFHDVQIEYGLQGFSSGTGTVLQVSSSNNTTIESLNPDTAYDFYIRRDCQGEGFSSWVGPLTVTTKEEPLNPNCLNPTNFTLVSSYTQGGVGIINLSWDPQNGETAWKVNRIISGNPFSSGIINNTSDDFYTLIGGNDTGVVYEFYVQALCGPDGNSGWEGPLLVTGP